MNDRTVPCSGQLAGHPQRATSFVTQSGGLSGMTGLTLRYLVADDFAVIFEETSDRASAKMAVFIAGDPNDRQAFESHMARVQFSSEIVFRVNALDDQLVGTMSRYPPGGEEEVT